MKEAVLYTVELTTTHVSVVTRDKPIGKRDTQETPIAKVSCHFELSENCLSLSLGS